MIDSKSLIHESASIAENVSIGAYSIIGKNVSIGDTLLMFQKEKPIRANSLITKSLGQGCQQ
jgi:acyl-[acyl carrier protein]--UDP-N-acetylglucosamine O-acyltransferase